MPELDSTLTAAAIKTKLDSDGDGLLDFSDLLLALDRMETRAVVERVHAQHGSAEEKSREFAIHERANEELEELAERCELCDQGGDVRGGCVPFSVGFFVQRSFPLVHVAANLSQLHSVVCSLLGPARASPACRGRAGRT